jgi:hypothetical protein
MTLSTLDAQSDQIAIEEFLTTHNAPLQLQGPYRHHAPPAHRLPPFCWTAAGWRDGVNVQLGTKKPDPGVFLPVMRCQAEAGYRYVFKPGSPLVVANATVQTRQQVIPPSRALIEVFAFIRVWGNGVNRYDLTRVSPGQRAFVATQLLLDPSKTYNVAAGQLVRITMFNFSAYNYQAYVEAFHDNAYPRITVFPYQSGSAKSAAAHHPEIDLEELPGGETVDFMAAARAGAESFIAGEGGLETAEFNPEH